MAGAGDPGRAPGGGPGPPASVGARIPSPRHSGSLCTSDSLVEERGDGAGSGALQLSKVTDPFQPARSPAREEAEALGLGTGVGVGGTHGPQPRTPGCPELPPTRASLPGEGDSALLAFLLPSAPWGPQHGEHFRLEIFEGCNFTGQCLEFQEDCPLLQSRGWAKSCVNAVKVYGDGA